MVYLNETCRICAHTASERIQLVRVFSAEGIKQDLQFKLYNCLKILITEQDRLPTVLCEFCISRIDAYFNLLRDCWSGQSYFATIPNIITQPTRMDLRIKKREENPNPTFPSTSTETYPQNQPAPSPSGGGRLIINEEYESSSISSPESLSLSVKLEQDEQRSQSESECLDLTSRSPSADKNPIEISSLKTRKSGVLQCSYCSKMFTHRGDFNKHLRKHTGEQPYECDVCKKKFAHTSNLTRHKLVHSGDLPFECEKCHRRFNRKDKLAAHKRCKVVS